MTAGEGSAETAKPAPGRRERRDERASSTEPSQLTPAGSPSGGATEDRAGRASGQLERWLEGEGSKTLGSLVEFFGNKSFALLFVLLLGVPALPLPTGGATHVFEVIAMLVALQLIIGREDIWLPRRWRGIELAGGRRERFIASLMRLIRRLERLSRPRLRFLFGSRVSNSVFGVLVICGSLGAFLAPPFTGLDTLPALSVVLLSVAVLLEDALLIVPALILGVVGIVLEIVLGSAAVHGVSSLFG
jgi:hypothetical protein